MTEDRENKIIEERIKGWTAFEYEKFLNEIDREIEKIRKKTKQRIKNWKLVTRYYLQHQQHVLLIQLFLCMKNTMNISGI